jgi:hypothetical protein
MRQEHDRFLLASPLAMVASLLLSCLTCPGCGAGATAMPAPAAAGPPGAPPSSPASPAPATAPAASTASVTSSPAPAPAAPADATASSELYDEQADPATLTPLFAKGVLPAFPKVTANEHECWQSVAVTGSARKDYESIVAKCGAATGSVEYVRPTIGKLHIKHDKRDTFIVPIRGGLCYRFFGVADGSIQDLDILIEKKGGALVGDDKTNGPVAIIEPDKAWCMDVDGTYNFLVEVDGGGQGTYVFGVWARKK